jgi:hypothetical protein
VTSPENAKMGATAPDQGCKSSSHRYFGDHVRHSLPLKVENCRQYFTSRRLAQSVMQTTETATNRHDQSPPNGRDRNETTTQRPYPLLTFVEKPPGEIDASVPPQHTRTAGTHWRFECDSNRSRLPFTGMTA